MLESFVDFISGMPWYWVLVLGFFLTFLENVFPPSPSDSALVFTGTLIHLGNVSFISLLLAATLGSTIGFVTMYYLGIKFDKTIIESEKFSFINKKTLEKPEQWFRKWGYFLIVANRFLSGTRAVISFFAGMSRLSLSKTTILSAISALVWNSILLSLGWFFADNWEKVVEYMKLYGTILTPVIVALVLGAGIYFWLKNKKITPDSDSDV